MPQFLKYLVKILCVDPNIERQAITWSPAFKNAMKLANTAPIPEAVA